MSEYKFGDITDAQRRVWFCRIGWHRWKDHFLYRTVQHHVGGFVITSKYDHVARRCTRCGKSVGVHAE